MAARDETARLVRAGESASRTVETIAEVLREHPRAEFIVLSGVDLEEAGYATLWPGAYREALTTIGIEHSGILVDETGFLEAAWPLLEAGGSFRYLYVRLEGRGFRAMEVGLPSSFIERRLPDIVLNPEPGGFLALDSIPPGYSAVTVSGAGESVSLRLPDVFDPCSLVTVNPCALRGDTAFFDLDSQQSWLSGTGSFVLVCGLEPGTRMVLSDIHLREEEIESRIGMHREALERISM